MTFAAALAPVDASALPEYPIGEDVRLDTHSFIAWERRRWLQSEMRLKGHPEARAYYFDLINIAFDETPAGTLPNDPPLLAKMVFCDVTHFEGLIAMPFGPLHRWVPCLVGDRVRLMHPMVTQTVLEAVTRRAHNRAQNEAAAKSKRLQRLRKVLAEYNPDFIENDAAVAWIDGWLEERTQRRNGAWHQRAIEAWLERVKGTHMARQGPN